MLCPEKRFLKKDQQPPPTTTTSPSTTSPSTTSPSTSQSTKRKAIIGNRSGLRASDYFILIEHVRRSISLTTGVPTPTYSLVKRILTVTNPNPQPIAFKVKDYRP
ncbi:hypothetical protein PGTUg99_004204 [Puccinia graminis f. sp. tritici]|uniref:Uncharacterized protein n=1 Tax=Puccinia graminis f. sp. tritici TaxID=56615 RepID=A0A5B0RGW7_PUCGR|nr:hypothetical protein PGTUg99_004204 [Puccinia graminis f. sp. tritici]